MIAYLRVSTDRQVEGQGLGVQEAAIRAWAREHGHRVYLVARDEGRSGAADLLERPGLATALGAVQSGTVGAIVVYRVDRLARDLVLQEQLLVEIRRAGGELHSTSPAEDAYLTDDPDDPTRAMIRQILGVVAQYERAMVRLRMDAGKRRKIARGGYGHGRPPYGYRAVGGELVTVGTEQRAISLMRKWRRDGLSYRQVADRMSRSTSRAMSTTRQGKAWGPSSVRRIVGR